MESEKVLKRIRELKEVHQELLGKTSGEVKVLEIKFSSHSDLMLMIADLLKVCKKALDGKDVCDDQEIQDPEINIGEVLNFAIGLLPYESQAFVDEVEELLKPYQ